MTAIMSNYEVSDEHAKPGSTTWLLCWVDSEYEVLEVFASKDGMITRKNELRTERDSLRFWEHRLVVQP